MQPFLQHKSKVIDASGKFKHVMAITLNPLSAYKEGVARCIVSREGDVQTAGYVDRSELYIIKKDNRFEDEQIFNITEKLQIKNQDLFVKKLLDQYSEDATHQFIGLEDPDIFVEEYTNKLHLFFTIPLISSIEDKNKILLGHAFGNDLYSLEMTDPVLEDAKEVSIMPKNTEGGRLNLVESSKKEDDFTYSVIKVAKADDMGKSWVYKDLELNNSIVFHPKEEKIFWIGGHASPGPILPKTFINLVDGKVLGMLNGREENIRIGNEIKYGTFSIGLFIYDFEKGKIDWVSPELLIKDTDAVTITFASQVIPVHRKDGEVILFAHVDDSFVRAYTLYSSEIQKLIPNEFLSR